MPILDGLQLLLRPRREMAPALHRQLRQCGSVSGDGGRLAGRANGAHDRPEGRPRLSVDLVRGRPGARPPDGRADPRRREDLAGDVGFDLRQMNAAPARTADGVAAKARRNALVKWLCEEKPSSKESAARSVRGV